MSWLWGSSKWEYLEQAVSSAGAQILGVYSSQNFLAVGERPVQSPPHDSEVLGHLLIVDVVAILPVGHLDLLGQRGVGDGGHAPPAQKPTSGGSCRSKGHGLLRECSSKRMTVRYSRFGKRKQQDGLGGGERVHSQDKLSPRRLAGSVSLVTSLRSVRFTSAAIRSLLWRSTPQTRNVPGSFWNPVMFSLRRPIT